MNIKKYLALIVVGMVLTFSCSNDDDTAQPEPQGAYENGILIANQGNFGQGNGSISFVSNDFSYSEHKVFSNVNGKPIGDVAQDISFYGDLAYIIVNNSQKIEVVNRYTFESVATIDSGLHNPRYMAISNGKGYVTNWGDGNNPADDFVAILNLETNLVSATIAVEEGPEQIISNGNTLYVAHAGGYSQNNIVSVINSSTDAVTTTITVGDVPNSMVVDGQGVLYVLSAGIPAWTENETGGQLDIINTSSNTVTSTIDFQVDQHPAHLSFDQAFYYYMGGEVYKLEAGSIEVPTESVIQGVNFNFMTVKDGVLYGADAKDYVSNGVLASYDLTTFAKKHSVEVGLIPGGIYFND